MAPPRGRGATVRGRRAAERFFYWPLSGRIRAVIGPYPGHNAAVKNCHPPRSDSHRRATYREPKSEQNRGKSAVFRGFRRHLHGRVTSKMTTAINVSTNAGLHTCLNPCAGVVLASGASGGTVWPLARPLDPGSGLGRAPEPEPRASTRQSWSRGSSPRDAPTSPPTSPPAGRSRIVTMLRVKGASRAADRPARAPDRRSHGPQGVAPLPSLRRLGSDGQGPASDTLARQLPSRAGPAAGPCARHFVVVSADGSRAPVFCWRLPPLSLQITICDGCPREGAGGDFTTEARAVREGGRRRRSAP
jgi:hypothetical protein